MSRAPDTVIEQAHSLARSARMLPAGDAAKALEQAVTMLQAAQHDVLVDAERSGDLKDSGCASVRSFASTILHRSAGDASAVARLARRLVDFPQLAAAYRAGLAHTGNLRMVIRHLPVCGLDVLQAHEEQLVLLATQAGPREINEFCQALADLNHPDRDQEKVKAHGARSVRIAAVGDLAHLDAMLDPVVAEQLKATLAALAKANREPDDPRTHAERCADALEDILRKGMDSSRLPKTARRRPHVNLTVQLETLLRMPGHGRALLERLGLIPASTAEQVCCDALVRMIVKHGDQILNVGRAHRVVTDAQHTALAATYRACVVPGCQVKFSDCDIHHRWWWTLGGPTDLDLQLPLCGAHHRWLHEGGYSIVRHHGLLVFRDPHGRVITDLDQVLHEQLNLLHQQTAAPADSHEDRDGDGDGGLADRLLADIGGWPDSPYRHGTWGWNGPDPDPPPGHDPPMPFETA